MFQTNTAREIFYIFLWLAGIILLYALVHTFILEPSLDTSSNTHAKKASTIVNKKIVIEKKLHIKSTHVDDIEKSPKDVKKPVHTTEVAKVLVVEKVVTSVKTVKEPSVNRKHIEHDDVIKTVKKILPIANTKEISIQKKADVTAIATSRVPKAVVMPEKSISIPTTPSVPTVPAITTKQRVEHKIEKTITSKISSEAKELNTQADALEKELSRDEKMELVEKARQLVIDKAEATRDEVMKSLER